MFLTENWPSVIVVEHVSRKRSLQFITIYILGSLFLRFLFLLFLLSIAFFGDASCEHAHQLTVALFLFLSRFLLVASSTV